MKIGKKSAKKTIFSLKNPLLAEKFVIFITEVNKLEDRKISPI